MINQLSKTTNNLTIDLSISSLIRIVVILLTLWFLYLIADIILMLFVVLILVSAIYPLADWFQEKKIPRWAGVLIIYLLFLSVFSLIIILLLPPIIKEISQLASDFPNFWSKIMSSFSSLGAYPQEYSLSDSIQSGLKSIGLTLGQAASGVFSTLSSIFGGLISLFVILVITFYMVVEEDALRGILKSIVPAQYQPYLVRLFNRLQKRIGQWVRGQLILCFIIGLMVYIGLSILGVNYALVLGLFAALAELVPYLGPIIASLPAVFIAFAQSPILALFVIILFVIINQLEGHLIVPKLMQRIIGLNPVIIIIALLIGAKLAGLIGAVLAIPTAIIISVFVEDFFQTGLPAADIKD